MRRVNLAFYRQSDWGRFLMLIDDRESMHDTWEEWHKSYMITKAKLILEGFTIHDFVVNLDELQHYCKVNGVKNDGKARSKFVSIP